MLQETFFIICNRDTLLSAKPNALYSGRTSTLLSFEIVQLSRFSMTLVTNTALALGCSDTLNLIIRLQFAKIHRMQVVDYILYFLWTKEIKIMTMWMKESYKRGKSGEKSYFMY